MKNLQTYEEFTLNEGYDSAALTKEFGGYDHSSFLKIAWYMDIDALEKLLDTSNKDMKFLKANSKGILGSFNRKDAQFLKNRIDFIKEIIHDKKEDPDYVPDHYKK